MGRRALILGATGLIGGHLLNHLLHSNAYDYVAIITRRDFPFEHPKLQKFTFELSELEKFKEVFKVHDVFCCLGTTIKKAGSESAFKQVDFEYPLAAGKIAIEAGAEQFLTVSAMGANSESRIFYNRVKGDMEEEIKKLPFTGVHIFRPSLLLGKREEFRLGERAAEWFAKPFSGFFKGSLKKYAPIPAETVACSMVVSALKRESGIHIYESDKIKEQTELKQP